MSTRMQLIKFMAMLAMAVVLAACTVSRTPTAESEETLAPRTEPTATGTTRPEATATTVPTAQSTATAQVAEIVCEAEGTQVLTPVVQVQADGVHIRVDNRSSVERFIFKQESPTSAFNQHQAPPGISETVSEEGPGSWKVICSDPNDYPQAGSSWVRLEVVDPDGVWLPDRPACEHPTGIHPDYVEYFEGRLPKGERRDPLELAREDAPRELPGWQASDVVEPAGYPEASPRKVRVKRGDEVVAVLSYRSDGEGGWFFGDILYCQGGESGQP
ncbi:MAG TPA: hypothetical protein VJ793_21745 [Anaerolineae bacterium]|nr:hypothetical protein [Anaerolineae bacterium]